MASALPASGSGRGAAAAAFYRNGARRPGIAVDGSRGAGSQHGAGGVAGRKGQPAADGASTASLLTGAPAANTRCTRSGAGRSQKHTITSCKPPRPAAEPGTPAARPYRPPAQASPFHTASCRVSAAGHGESDQVHRASCVRRQPYRHAAGEGLQASKLLPATYCVASGTYPPAPAPASLQPKPPPLIQGAKRLAMYKVHPSARGLAQRCPGLRHAAGCRCSRRATAD